MSMLVLLLTLIVLWVLAYHRISLRLSSLTLFLLLMAHTAFGDMGWLSLSMMWLLFIVLLLPLNLYFIRRKFISKPLYAWYRKVMPKMSRTEKEAIEAGTVSWEAQLFDGKPQWEKCFDIPAPRLSEEEKAFLTGPVEALCQMINDWEITHVHSDLSPEIWRFLKEEGFFSLIIPKSYGGKAFSAYAHSEILAKIYGVSVSVASTVAVPNSLGPAELLLHYGTEAQKNYYLPRLAKGEEIPCFALTNPTAGSDAGSIPDTGIVCRGQFNGEEIVGIRLNWDKRYITLAPVATVLGLAFKLYDPEGLLGGEVERGITCALIPTHTPGIKIGRRHFPLNTAFQNGPTQGNNVFIPVDWIIGGAVMAGQGWRMLVECLSVGRAISLPSSAIGGSKMAAFATGAYARIRKQFHLPIGQFEGVAEALARIGGFLYLMDAARQLTLAIIDKGERPAILSAIMKYHATEFSRKVAMDAMDIHGGKGICLGPKNYLGRFYQSSPIAITVEGANILTRSMIIFGQGAMRCHSYILAELDAGQDTDPKRGLKLFDKAFFGHLGLIVSNVFRSLFLGLTNGHFVKTPKNTTEVRRYYQRLTRFSAAFALLADFSMGVLGGELKRRERLSARLGDILSYLYMTSAVLKRYHNEGQQKEDLPLVNWTCQYAFSYIQQSIAEILQNFPHKGLRLLLKGLIFPLGKIETPPSDQMSQQVADILLSPSDVRDRLTDQAFKGNLMQTLEIALHQVMVAEPVEAKIFKAVKEKIIKMQEMPELVEAAHAAGVITALEVSIVLSAEKARAEVIAVDDFDAKILTHTD